MTGSVITSFALTMFVLCRQKREEKSLGFHETFFFLLKYIFFLAWRIYSFTRNNLAHYFFGLVSFFLVRFVLFFSFPSRQAHVSILATPGGLRGFFSVVGRVANVRETKRIRRCVFICAAECTPAEAEAGQPV